LRIILFFVANPTSFVAGITRKNRAQAYSGANALKNSYVPGNLSNIVGLPINTMAHQRERIENPTSTLGMGPFFFRSTLEILIFTLPSFSIHSKLSLFSF